MDLPSTGTITFLFTDIEGSTRLWEQFPDVMKSALRRHDAILRAAIEGCGGPRGQDDRRRHDGGVRQRD